MPASESGRALLAPPQGSKMHETTGRPLYEMPDCRGMLVPPAPAKSTLSTQMSDLPGAVTRLRKVIHASFSTGSSTWYLVLCAAHRRPASRQLGGAPVAGATLRQDVESGRCCSLALRLVNRRGRSNTTNAATDQHRLRCCMLAAQPCGTGVQGVCVTASLVVKGRKLPQPVGTSQLTCGHSASQPDAKS